MNSAQILGYPLLLISALELFLGLLLLKQNPRNSNANRAAAACAVAAALWSLSAALMYIRFAAGMEHVVFARISWIGWFTVPTAIQTMLFLSDEESRTARIIGWVLYPFWTVVLALCLFTDLVVRSGYVPIPFTNDPGPLDMPLRLIGSAMAFWLIYEIFRLRRRVTGYRRAQLNYYLYGTTFFGTGGAVVGGFLQVFTGHGLEPSLSAYFSFPWVLMIFYAITRFRLFDIRLVLSRTLFILLLSFAISAIQHGLFKILAPVIGVVATIFISVPVIGILFFGTPLSRHLQRWINDLMIGGRYSYQAMLRGSARAMITILERDDLLRYIVDSVRRGMGVEHVRLYLQEGTAVGLSCVTMDGGSSMTTRCDLPPEAYRRISERERPVLLEELEASARSGDRDLATAMRTQGASLMVPLRSRGIAQGAIALGERSSGDPYLQSDLEVLETVGSYAAVAIDNARLFEETGRMRASLREQQDIFRMLAQTLPAGLFIHRGGKFLYANPAGVRMTGYPMEEILNMEFWEIVHPAYRELTRERGQARIRGNDAPAQYEFKILRKDGIERWVLLTAGLIEYGGSAAVIGTIFDITDRKTAEVDQERYYQERIAEQERFSAILSTTSEGFWIADETDRLVFVNDAYCRISGYPREELLTMSIADVEADESAETVVEHGDHIRATGFDRFETRHRRKDGSLVDLEVTVNRYRDEKMVFAFFRDITDRKRAEEALRESERRFRQVSETAQEWIWEVDRDGRYTYASPVVTTILGYLPEEIIGKRYFYDFFLPEEREQLKREAFQVFELKAPFRDFVNRNLHRDGREVFLSTSGMPILDGNGALLGYRGVDFDITGRIRAEEERRQLYEESVDHYQRLLDEQQRHQAEKEKILKDLHDGIGGLTTNINLLAELALKNDDLSAVRRSLATIAELSRESLAEIRGFMQSLDERELTWHAIAAEFRHLGTAIIEPHGIRFSIGISVPETWLVPSSTIAMNLLRIYKESLSNIVKHARAKAVEVRFTVSKGRAILEIHDDGVGIGERRGSGRGLPNMQARAGEMGGTLTITPAGGTRIVLEFPIPEKYPIGTLE